MLFRSTMIGTRQEDWLFDGFSHSRARWNVLGQDVMMAQWRQKNASGETAFWTDDWNGYPANRDRVLRYLYERRIANPIVLTGDIHSFWANDLKLNFDDPNSPTVATEFVGTSITSHPPPYRPFADLLPGNPHVRYFESRKRGYAALDIGPDKIVTRFRSLSDVNDMAATVSTLKTFAVENGRPGVVEA